MRRNIVVLAGLPALFLAGCAEDIWTRNEPLLVVEGYLAAGDPAYEETRVDTVDGKDVAVINLGRVPFYRSRTATFSLLNDATVELVVDSINFTANVSGEDWVGPEFVQEPEDPTQWSIPALETRMLKLTYSPEKEGQASAELLITSNAGNGAERFVIVEAEGYFEGGAPDIDVRLFDDDPVSPSGPLAGDCDALLDDGIDDNDDGVVDGCLVNTPLDLGAVGLGSSVTNRLYIRNASDCPPYPGAPDCGTCVLTLDQDPSRQNLGVGFKAGTNVDGYFTFQGSTTTPAHLPQSDDTCDRPSSVPLVINFNAPTVSGTYTATVVLESNDPFAPLVEIPVRATAVNAPIAIADFRAFDPNNVTAPYTEANDIDPLDRVYFDGRAKGTPTSTHDTRDPADVDLITDYIWEVVEYPPDAALADLDFQGQGTGLFSMIAIMAGYYEVRLTVRNTDDMESLDTPQARVAFEVIPSERLHIQLIWDNPSNDQDLHLTNLVVDDRVCNEPWDCYYSNKTPIWFSGYPASEGPNPGLDRDDTQGLGPENIQIEDPLPGVYRVYVHYYGGFNAAGQSGTLNTVRIWLNSVMVADWSRTLSVADDVWAVADITWYANGTGSVTPYPSDASGQIGAIEYMPSCSPPEGWTFP